MSTKYLPPYAYNSIYGSYNQALEDYTLSPNKSWPFCAGIVQYVNMDDQSCTVFTENGQRLDRVQCIMPWFSYSHGQGLYAYPEANSRVVVGQLNNGTWYIFGFIPLRDTGGSSPYLNKKSNIGEGGVKISTDFGNSIEIKKGDGSISLYNTPLCNISLESIKDNIITHSQRAKTVTNVGKSEQTMDDDGNTTQLHTIRMNIKGTDNFIKLVLGSVEEEEPTPENPKVIASLNLCDKAGITVDTNGNMDIYINSINISVAENINAIIGKNNTVTVNGTQDIKAVTGFSVHTTNLDLKAASDLTLQAGANVDTKAAGTIKDSAAAIMHNRGSASVQTPESASVPEMVNSKVVSLIEDKEADFA